MLLGIDPGTTQSGWAVLDAGRVKESGVSPNAHLLERLRVVGGYIKAGLHAPMTLAVERFEARINPVKGNPTATEAINGGTYSISANVFGVGMNYKF